MARDPNKPGRDWYSVPVSSVRRALILIGLLVVFFSSGIGYQQWERFTLRRKAADVVDRAEQMWSQLSERDDIEGSDRERQDIRDALDRAWSEYRAERYASALEIGQRNLVTLESILQIGERPEQGTIRFLNVHGGVEFRRGERGAWRRVRAKDRLNPGDWVKTSDGTAEILFPDGSVYTLRQNTMVNLGGAFPTGGASSGEPVTDIRFGWVELNTAQSSTVTTPESEARIAGDSEALVSYDADRQSGRFAAYEGGIEVRSTSGDTRRVKPLQQVEQRGSRLSEPRGLPKRPQLLQPLDGYENNMATEKAVVLSWKPVPGARRYALRVARDRLFASSFIDVKDRRKTTATLGVRSEGSFYWQVAAIAADGSQGPWSDAWSFRVAALRRVGESNDQTPPDLEILEAQTYGSLVIVNGKTESGATVTINGENVSLQVDGSFSKTIQMNREGNVVLEIVATDAWGNSNQIRKTVFIDAF